MDEKTPYVLAYMRFVLRHNNGGYKMEYRPTASWKFYWTT